MTNVRGWKRRRANRIDVAKLITFFLRLCFSLTVSSRLSIPYSGPCRTSRRHCFPFFSIFFYPQLIDHLLPIIILTILFLIARKMKQNFITVRFTLSTIFLYNLIFYAAHKHAQKILQNVLVHLVHYVREINVFLITDSIFSRVI